MVLGRYLGWRKRFIHAKKRMVHLSNEARGTILNLAPTLHKDAQILLELIRAGGALTPHLSRDVAVFYQPKPVPFASNKVLRKAIRRRDHDMLLYEWDVHHLHLSDTLDKSRTGGFTVRGNLLLYVVFRWDDAFVINVRDHGSFAAKALAEIVHPLHGIVGLSHHITDEGRKSLRSHGISSPFFEHRGKYYGLGMGYASDGSSIRATMRANQTVLAARKCDEILAKNPSIFRRHLKIKAAQPIDLRCVLRADDDWAIVDVNSNRGFKLL